VLSRDQAYEGVQDNESSIYLFDRLEEAGEVLWEGEGTRSGGVRGGDWLLDKGEDLDAGEIGPQRCEQLELGGGGIGIGSYENNTSLYGWGAIRHGGARRDGSGDLKGEEGFAAVVVSVEEGDACHGETLLPKPADGLGQGIRERVFVDGKGDRECVNRCLVLLRHLLERGKEVGGA
jgi:hypothetical protein